MDGHLQLESHDDITRHIVDYLGNLHAKEDWKGFLYLTWILPI